MSNIFNEIKNSLDGISSTMSNVFLLIVLLVSFGFNCFTTIFKTKTPFFQFKMDILNFMNSNKSMINTLLFLATIIIFILYLVVIIAFFVNVYRANNGYNKRTGGIPDSKVIEQSATKDYVKYLYNLSKLIFSLLIIGLIIIIGTRISLFYIFGYFKWNLISLSMLFLISIYFSGANIKNFFWRKIEYYYPSK